MFCKPNRHAHFVPKVLDGRQTGNWNLSDHFSVGRDAGAIHGASGTPPRRSLPPQGRDPVPLEARRSGARLSRQVYEVEPLPCPRCGGTMKILSVLERQAIIRQILAPPGPASCRAQLAGAWPS